MLKLNHCPFTWETKTMKTVWRANGIKGVLYWYAKESCLLEIKGEWIQFESCRDFAKWHQEIKLLPWWQLTLDVTDLSPENGGLTTDFAAEAYRLIETCRQRHGIYEILADSRRQLGIMGFPKILSAFGPYVFFREDGWLLPKHVA